MNDPDHDLEAALRAMHWRKPAQESLQSGLSAALAEHRRLQKTTAAGPKAKTRTPLLALMWNFVPWQIRWPLAACWLLSLFFKLSTPDPVPPSLRDSLARLPQVDPVVVLAQLDEQQRLLAQLIEELHRHRDVTPVSIPAGPPPLP